jgi:diacylglycerol O-acyltransferase
MERLSPLDAFFLFIEDGNSHMHIAACAIFEGPAPPYRRVVAAIADKLDLVPRYRQVVRFVLLQLGRPVWIDDPPFRLEYHVRHTALPTPGGLEELRDLMGRLMSQELDRNRPLWEAWMVEGLQGGRWALIMKIHHCMADGISGNDLFTVLLSREPNPPVVDSSRWQPAPGPSGLRLAADAVWRLALTPYDEFRALCQATAAPRLALSRLRDTTEGMLSYARRVPSTKPNSLVGSLGPHRRWTFANATLDDVKTIRRTFDATVNDVVVAAVTAGLHELLLSRGEPVQGRVVRTLIPVSVRAENERGNFDNRVSGMLADLPVGIDDPVERLVAVRKELGMLKASHQAGAGQRLTAMAELAPSAALAFAERNSMRILRRLPQHTINTVTTNVPGPQHPLYLAGREMLEYLPFVPIVQGMRVGLAIMSYNGKVAFGVTGDYDTVPDIEVLAGGIEDAIAELLKLAV